MLRIGITYRSRELLFDSDSNHTSILLAELMQQHGHEVTFIQDTTACIRIPPLDHLSNLSIYDAKGFDVLLDVDGLLSPDLRRTIATKTIVFLRTFLQFTEMDHILYIESPYVPRSMKGVYEVWCWDILNPKETIPSIQTLFPCPIRRVPFVWSSLVSEYLTPPRQPIDFVIPESWTVHIAERNVDNTSSCIMPLVAIRELIRQKILPATYRLHGVDGIKENRFFKENVLHNIEYDTMPVQMVPREPYSNWLDPCHILFSHTRFTHLQPSLLHAVWFGIPLIHNSSILRDLHPQLAQLYYTGNEIRGMCKAFQTFSTNPTVWYENQLNLRAALMDRFGMKHHYDAWASVLETLSPTLPVHPQEYVIAYSDMWPGFQYDSNVIIDALRHEFPSETFRGCVYDSSCVPHLLIFGPFGTTWKQVPSSVPKILFSAENWPLPSDPSISLYVTSSYKEDDTHIRLPTWMTFLDWYSTATELPVDSTANPIRFPVSLAMRPHPVPFSQRPHFCGFVVSNPTCAFRNQAFQHINQYKKVDSGGSLYNNMGQPLALRYPGGGGGDLSKYHFFSERRFSISFENGQAPGYITEKVLHAKMAGCVPLYWGDAKTDMDFVPNSFINVSAVTDPQKLIQIIQSLESRPDLCEKLAATPILDEERKQNALSLLSRVSQRIMRLLRPIDMGWSKAYVINLDSRTDRWASLCQAEPALLSSAIRISAVPGRTLTLSPSLYSLFEHNQFKWKKSVMGCMLSHLSVWSKLLQEKGDLFLIMEDDVRFHAGWQTTWNNARHHIPKDADLLFLGGILPPNQSKLASVLQPVNNYWSSILPNTLFSAIPAPLFHLCAFSYLLTRSGIEKLMAFIMKSEPKLFAPCDHFLINPMVGLRHYLLQPFLTFCFQEEDPAYQNSQFNDLQRKDTFDSDICNNNECFQDTDLAPFQQKQMVIYHIPTSSPIQLYEHTWLEYIMNTTIVYQPIQDPLTIPPGSWFLAQRPYTDAIQRIFTLFQENQRPFRVLHLSDEFGMDSISFYSWSMCTAIIRNYLRHDLPSLPHLHVIPLGYHYRPADVTHTYDKRTLQWSFHGTNWFQREEQLEPFRAWEPYDCRLQPDWNHETATSKTEYSTQLENSKFCPILKGNNVETFRLYEALEAGTLPITTITDTTYLAWIEENMGLSSLYDWTKPMDILRTGLSESVRKSVMERWISWKKRIQQICNTI